VQATLNARLETRLTLHIAFELFFGAPSVASYSLSVREPQ